VTSESNVAANRPSYLPQSVSEHSLGQPGTSGQNPRFSFSHRREESREREESTTEPSFLPDLNFDDFHERITSYEPDLNSFPAPGTRGRLDAPSTRAPLDTPSRVLTDGKADHAHTAMDGAAPRGPGGQAEQPKVSRSASLVRRFSNARRTTSRSADTSAMPPPSAPLSSRARRQSTLPSAPATGPNPAARPPRKSMGPGLITQGFEERRAAREAQSAFGSVSRTASINKGRNLAPGGTPAAEQSRTFANRNLKAKSLQPPPRNSSQPFLNPVPISPITTAAPGTAISPGRAGGNRTHTPSSANKRQSTIQQHVSGLGARTISPTDARRLKRMSTVAPPLPIPQAPLTPQPDSLQNLRANVHSPSVFQQPISLTPSSARATPDLAPRAGNASGPTISQTSSLSSLRQQNGGNTSRNSQILNSSRLPTPKPRNVHSSAGLGDEEVPPVPAIPKAYESPKDQMLNEQTGSYFVPRRPRVDSEELPGRASRTQAGSRAQTGSKLASRPSVDSPRTSQDDRKASQPSNNPRHRRGLTVGTGEGERPSGGAGPNLNKKNLQPLRLPPLNLLPLSTPTAARIASYPAPSLEVGDGNATPPPKRNYTKTPSTPMTASKATFFSRSQRESEDEYQPFNMRSASSHHIMHNGFGERGTGMSPTTPIAIPSPMTRQAPTPFSSNSLPKNSGEFGGHLFAKPMDEYTYDHQVNPEAVNVRAPSPKPMIAPRRDAASTRTSTSDEPSTPASTTSLRRKLSLSWKRSSSKASQRAKAEAERQERAERPEMTEKQREEVKRASRQNEMPPPRLPASATWNVSPNHGEPQSRPSLDSRVRKPSASIANNASNASLDADMAVFMGSAESKPEGQPPPPYAEHRRVASRSSSSSLLNPMQRMLGAKSSLGTLKARHLDTNLDKDDLAADKIMEKMGSRRKDFELAARELDELRRRAHPKERASPVQAVQMVNLNIFERGEIIDYKEVYFCGARGAKKHVGDLDHSTNNFGYDDDRGDYNIVMGDHLAYRYEVVDMLGKGSFGQVVRCIDHKTGQLVAIKIIRNKKRFHQQALVEVNILQKLREWVRNLRSSMILFLNLTTIRIPRTSTA
jgi:dual specificity tyrosine-phosphorylation-regulated kinase 2/3/4